MSDEKRLEHKYAISGKLLGEPLKHVEGCAYKDVAGIMNLVDVEIAPQIEALQKAVSEGEKKQAAKKKTRTKKKNG